MRHCMRRYATFLQRIDRREVDLGYVPDVQNPADFLTKFVDKKKFDSSIEYATNGKNAVPPYSAS